MESICWGFKFLTIQRDWSNVERKLWYELRTRKLRYTQTFLTVWCADQILPSSCNAGQYCDDKQWWRQPSVNMCYHNRGWVIMPLVLSLGTDFKCWLVLVPIANISYSSVSNVFIGVNVWMFSWYYVNKYGQHNIH